MRLSIAKQICSFAFAVLIAAFIGRADVYAQSAGSEACAADFMNQIVNRAALEGQREMIMDAIVIRKPDSVLEYSCFDQTLKNTADFAGPIFTEATRWQGAQVNTPEGPITINVYMGTTRLDDSLDAVIMESLNNYANDNFAHDFLGGAAGISNSIASNVSGADKACAFMDEVYFIAKCNNFRLDDQFFTFERLVSLDPRLLPNPCGSSGITQSMIAIAGNEGFAHATYDKLDPMINFIDPSSCEAPIPTGMKVTQTLYNVDLAGNVNKTENVFDDHICVNPGCYYDGRSSCKKN